MVRFFWLTILTAIAGVVQLFTFRSLELTIVLFSLNFMVFGLEFAKTETKSNVLLKIESVERYLNDVVSNLISPRIARVSENKKEIIEWLNRF